MYLSLSLYIYIYIYVLLSLCLWVQSKPRLEVKPGKGIQTLFSPSSPSIGSGVQNASAPSNRIWIAQSSACGLRARIIAQASKPTAALNYLSALRGGVRAT